MTGSVHELIAEAHRIIRNHNKANGNAYDEWLAKAGIYMRQIPAPPAANDIDFTPLTFGKYKGKTPREIYDYDPGYLVWMSMAIKPSRVSDRLAELANQIARRKRSPAQHRVTHPEDF